MNRHWLVFYGGLFLGTSLTAVGWSQTTPSLAERIDELRSGWSDGSTPDAATTPAPPSNSTAPTRKPAKPATALPPSRDSGLPQVDSSSLIPKGLFSRPGTENSLERPKQAPAQRSQSAATRPTAKSTASPRTATQSRPGAAKPAPATANEFTLPGLSNPTANANRNATSPAPRSIAAKPSPRTNVATATPVAPRRETIADAGATSTNAAAEPNVRRSPELRAPVHFDPDSVRDDLAGTFQSAPKEDVEARGQSGDEHSPTIADASSTDPKQHASTSRSPERDDADADVTISDDDQHNETAFPSVNRLSGREGGTSHAVSRGNGATNETPQAAKVFQTSPQSPTPAKANSLVRTPASSRDTQPSNSAADARETFADGDSRASSTSGLAVTNQAPVIISDIRGPKQIVIGRPASYTVRLRNQSAVPADEMVVSIKIPSWAEVVNTSPTHGNVTQAESDANSGTLQWQISQLAAQGTESLNLELIPRASRPFELGVTWTFAPVGSRAVVEVQEPKLRMQIAGPDDVLFGKPNVYRLTLSNPGTGLAENVSIAVVPPGGDDRDAAISHAIGDLAPGSSKTVEIEMTARDAGKLRVQAMATAEGDLHAETTKELFCRKPELEVDWRGPAMQYAGTPATYFFRVRNPGTAAADDVAVHAVLPAGAEFVSASDGNAVDASKREVNWRVGSLGPGDDCYMELRCVVRMPGENQIKVTAATSAGDLSDVKMAATNVVALADLKLDVTDPPGPVPVGEEAIYEVRIENRGTSAAEDVNVVGLFSEGLEPEAVDGGSYNVADGRVSFRPIRKIPAGQKVQLQIHARAMKTGTHVFRAEVLCRDQEIKLAAEQTTRFYDSQAGHDGAPSAPATARRPDRVR